MKTSDFLDRLLSIKKLMILFRSTYIHNYDLPCPVIHFFLHVPYFSLFLFMPLTPSFLCLSHYFFARSNHYVQKVYFTTTPYLTRFYNHHSNYWNKKKISLIQSSELNFFFKKYFILNIWL